MQLQLFLFCLFFLYLPILIGHGQLSPLTTQEDLSQQPILMEICDNAKDDDGDGFIDLNDPDCDCPVIEPISLIPNPSFEEMHCCPGSRSQLYCAETWIQASEPTTDYIHTCGWMGWQEYPPPLPFPDGEGIVGFRDGRVFVNIPEMNWKEYAGACLLGPLEAGINYRFEFHVGFVDRNFSPPINITFFGTADCDNLPFGIGDQDLGCPSNGPGWTRLGSVFVSGDHEWVKASINVTPEEDIYGIAIGPDCPGIQTNLSLYYFFDNLVLANQESFDLVITASSHPCAEDLKLRIPARPDLAYQWYLNGIALPGEVQPEISKLYGEGSYQVRISGDNTCKITRVYHHELPLFIEFDEESICAGDEYNFGPAQLSKPGNYVHTFQSIDNCDSIVTLKLHVIGLQSDSLSVRIFKGEEFEVGNHKIGSEGQHILSLTSSLGCDSLLVLNLGFYEVYFPNVFSPNRDGINDKFNIYGSEELVIIEQMHVYDRWGNLVFTGRDFLPGHGLGWDGSIQGKDALPGVYLYHLNLLMDDGKSRSFSGEISLVR